MIYQLISYLQHVESHGSRLTLTTVSELYCERTKAQGGRLRSSAYPRARLLLMSDETVTDMVGGYAKASLVRGQSACPSILLAAHFRKGLSCVWLPDSLG